jgi:hypothetical protein
LPTGKRARTPDREPVRMPTSSHRRIQPATYYRKNKQIAAQKRHTQTRRKGGLSSRTTYVGKAADSVPSDVASGTEIAVQVLSMAPRSSTRPVHGTRLMPKLIEV